MTPPAQLPAPFTRLRHVASTGSTNADLVTYGTAGDVLVTDHQTAGRGRLQRRWEEPAGSSLLFSVRLAAADVPPGRLGWVPLALGVALADAVAARAPGHDVGLKWPNDVLLDGAKLAGVLGEATADAVVIGAGCNIRQSTDELPVPGATSLALAGATDLDRDRLLHETLLGLARWWQVLTDASVGPEPLAQAYRARCRTLDREVAVELGTETLHGTAVDVADGGELVVATPAGRRTVGAGDVQHVR